MRTSFLISIVGGAVVFSTLLGCVPQQKYDDLLTAYRSKEQDSLSMRESLDSVRANENLLRTQLTDARGHLDHLETMTSEQAAELAQMEQDFHGLSQRITSLRVAALPPELNARLTMLRDQYPGVLSFDEATGMLRFSADMTFGSGSASLSSDGANAVAKLAAILNSTDGVPFDLELVGHTDNVPIGRPETRRNFPTNMHLAVGRAISVRRELVKDKVAAGRMKVGGWGEHRPVSVNPATGGSTTNRRVDLYLIPSTGSTVQAATTDTPAPTQATATEPEAFPPK